MSKILKKKQEIEIEIDEDARAAYIYFGNKKDELKGDLKSSPVDENIIIDYSQDGKLFGIEILNLNILPEDLKE